MADKPSAPAEGTKPDEAQSDTSHSDAPPPDAAPKEKTSEREGKTEIPRAQFCRACVFLASYGNAAGDKIESTLSTVGGPVGKGLETVTAPVGGVVDGLVGGLMRSGGAYGDVSGVGAGNMDHKRAREKEEAHEPVGGEEETPGNPLGLHGDKE